MGIAALWLIGRNLRPGANARPAPAQLQALADVGLEAAQAEGLMQGKMVVYSRPSPGGHPTYIVAQYIQGKLRVGILSVHDESGGGLRAFIDFEQHAFALAKALGLKNVDYGGIAVGNPKILKFLQNNGFIKQVLEIPEDLGFGCEIRPFWVNSLSESLFPKSSRFSRENSRNFTSQLDSLNCKARHPVQELSFRSPKKVKTSLALSF